MLALLYAFIDQRTLLGHEFEKIRMALMKAMGISRSDPKHSDRCGSLSEGHYQHFGNVPFATITPIEVSLRFMQKHHLCVGLQQIAWEFGKRQFIPKE